MSPPLSPQTLVAKWRNATLKERSAAQSHFNDLCALIGHPSPAEADPTGESFTFEAFVNKTMGGQGFADVWKKGYFAWEYKGHHGDLDQAYQQLLQYREALRNPPLLIVSDLQQIIIHTNFTNSVKQVHVLTLDDLLKPEGLDLLRYAFNHPDALRARETTADVTQQAASQFARLAELLRQWGAEPHRAAHFLIRLLFCLFAEDIHLLPDGLFSKLVTQTAKNPKAFTAQLRQLFGAMARGGYFGVDAIPHFDGGLFDDESVLELSSDGLDILRDVCALNWGNIEPSILGTLFERSLDPTKRAQLGAHYTSKEDILLIVEPVLMAPLRRRWTDVQVQARKTKPRVKKLLLDFAHELSQLQILDPACGSGNFLYVALRQLLDLEKEVITFADQLGVGRFFPAVSPAQLHGIERNPYARELAQTTVWIGYIQWLRENGFGFPSEPILKPLNTIVEMDAILDPSGFQNPKGLREPEWPQSDVIIGNPPFLGGGRKMREAMGDEYVDKLFELYEGRVPHGADLVCYWFEKARALIEAGKAKHAGLLATQGIRGGANREVLEHIKKTGDIFMAWSDHDWVLDGANVHVSMIGFDSGEEQYRELDGKTVNVINADLTTSLNLTTARSLNENQNLSFRGDTKGGAFDISHEVAVKMLNAPRNPNKRPNSDVVRPWANGQDITQHQRGMWIIDFGVDMSEEEAALYELPFEHVRRMVKPERLKSKREAYQARWWIHMESRPALRVAIDSLKRYIVTPAVSKYRVFVWLEHPTLPDQQLIVIARDDDYFFGVLHSKLHELWSRAQGTQLREAESGQRYTPTTTFETFPFPWPPNQEPKDDPRVQAIANAARELVAKRGAWLKPESASEKDLKKRTLTNLYNERPTWLALAHRKLDEAVLDAYGWAHDLSDDEILARLLALNLQRADNTQ